MNGTITKSVGGLYEVLCGKTVFICRARGRFKFDKVVPLVGDKVEIREIDKTTGYIIEIEQRRNSLVRPKIANIDNLFIISCAAPPVSDLFFIDCLTLAAEYNNITPIICINKCDINKGTHLQSIYNKAGIKTILCSAVKGIGIEEIFALMQNKISAFAGNSGAGKSTVLNAIDSGFAVKTNIISNKIGRGVHTTRHCELFALKNGGFIADTPGFSVIDSAQMGMTDKKRIMLCFPEFEVYLNKCQYSDCAHIAEDGCKIIEATKKGEIAESRYESYLKAINIL